MGRRTLDPKLAAKIAKEYTTVKRATSTTLGAKYGITPTTVCNILKRQGIPLTKMGLFGSYDESIPDEIANCDGDKATHRAKHKAALLKQEGGRCAICRKRLKVKTAYVDHCHDTKLIRSVLCNKCNIGLGMFCEDVELLKAATKYLQKHKRKGARTSMS